MSDVLSVLLTHLSAEKGRNWLEWRRAVCPGEQLLIVFGGRREDMAGIGPEPCIWIPSDRLKTKDHQRERQSYHAIWRLVSDWMRNRAYTHVLFMEYDHLPLVPDLAGRWVRYLEERDADLAGFAVTRVDGTNNPHALYHDVDKQLTRFIQQFTVRSDPRTVISMLGTGSLWTREAFDAVAAVEEPFPVYLELWFATVSHHLGFRVVDMPAEQKRWVRSSGEFSSLIKDAFQAGAWSIHPIKRPPDLTLVPAAIRRQEGGNPPIPP